MVLAPDWHKDHRSILVKITHTLSNLFANAL